MSKSRRTTTAAAAIIVALMAAPATSHAASATWNGSTSTLWSTGANWNTGNAPGSNMGGGGSNTDIATFGARGLGAFDPSWNNATANGEVAGLTFQDEWTLTMSSSNGSVRSSGGIDVNIPGNDGLVKITGTSQLRSSDSWISTIATGDTLWIDVQRHYNSNDQLNTWNGGGTVLFTKNFSTTNNYKRMLVTANTTMAVNASMHMGTNQTGKEIAVQIDNGSKLAGTGSISAGGTSGGRNILINGTVTPGWIAGPWGAAVVTATLTMTDVQTVNLNGTYAVDIVGAAADLIAIHHLNLGGSSILNLTALTPLLNTPYTIATYSGTRNGTFSNALPENWTIDYGAGTNSAITVMFIPEPASLALLAAGGLLMLPRRKRVN